MSRATIHTLPTAPATPDATTWQGWGTAIKPAHEPICVARKPFSGTVAANVLAHGTGALNIDACRVGGPKGTGNWGGRTVSRGYDGGWDGEAKPNLEQSEKGRWPANLLFTHAYGCTQVGVSTKVVGGGVKASSTGDTTVEFVSGYKSGDGFVGRPVTSASFACVPGCPVGELEAQSEGASRYFSSFEWSPTTDVTALRYVAKPSKRERRAGITLCSCAERAATANPVTDTAEPDAVEPTWVATTPGNGANGRCRSCGGVRRQHETVKPVSLMRFLVRLVTPAGGTVLDPFLGSGSTAVACELEGFDWVGCELTEAYLPLIEERTAWAEMHAVKEAAHQKAAIKDATTAAALWLVSEATDEEGDVGNRVPEAVSPLEPYGHDASGTECAVRAPRGQVLGECPHPV